MEKVDIGEGLQNIERELQGERTSETIFITWQLYLNGSQECRSNCVDFIKLAHGRFQC